MSHGRIIASGTPEQLKAHRSGERTLRARLRAMDPKYEQAVKGVPGVSDVEVQSSSLLMQVTAAEEEVNPLVLRRLVEAGAEVISFSAEGRTLEDVYLGLVHQEVEGVQV